MVRGFIYIGFLMMIGALESCHNPNGPWKLLPAGQAAMRQRLKGTWILQEYEDSIDAGLTPKLLEYMRDGPNQITYSPGNNLLEVRGIFESKELGRFWDDARKVDSCLVVFVPDIHKLIFTIVEHSYTSVHVVDTGEFVINGSDTLLRFYNDSMSLNFVRYDGDQCPNTDPYEHLINSRFISGKYYTIADTAKLHHIIFTKCGGIEGAENISADFQIFDRYTTSLAFDHTGPDQIRLYTDKKHHAENMNIEVVQPVLSWEAIEDSLILRRESFRSEDPIVLVRSR